ncbi:NADH-quinone oxidoreductase subunit A [Uliginosibacterium sp. H3]|uniref:NADH-quinone oxidoreductase subunit A n=1 Tax=Uliginosibacterium silvisoli TaxID=3114758 RepID=A0ABU6K5G1_9RHOO|nr:NADH-quinone oxidoreductase subunit A [Uliginosibacterium sp. H3]
MLENYFPVLLFIILGVVIAAVPVILGWVIAPHKPDAQKNSPYECGFEAFEDARMKFDVRYYLLAILFILFDLEVAFLLPWASILKDIAATPSLRAFGFFEMLIFLGVLIIGYVYVWRKGALDWE